MSGSQSSLTPYLGLYDTATLVATMPSLKTPSSWLLDTFFPTVVESETPEVAIDVDVGLRRLAPFVSPLVEGKNVESRTWQTNLFRPAYIKDRRVPDLTRPVRRQIGERLAGGGMSPQERFEANLVFEMQDQVEMIQRRLEWMAASALTTGTVVIAGDGYPNPLTVNFQRSASNTVALTGSAAWGQAGVSPTQWLTTWALQVQKASGAVATDIVLTPSPWAALQADLRLINAIWAPRSGENNHIDMGGYTPKGGQLVGVWGQFNFWLYNEWYIDNISGIESPMLADGTVLVASREMQGVRAFGQIMDPAFNYGPMAYAPKTWYVQDPAQVILMMQSAPIVIPSRVNACLAATVMTSGGSIVPPPI
jgi:hypothetical protein